jgi:hypothetical protein
MVSQHPDACRIVVRHLLATLDTLEGGVRHESN